jgi:hypothetical protein
MYCKGLGHAILGQSAEARRALGSVDGRMPSESPFEILRLWSMMKADVLLALGHDKEAFQVAGEFLGEIAHARPAVNFEGQFARWIALLGDDQGRPGEALGLLNPFADGLDALDALDQVEVLAACVFLRRRIGLPLLDQEDELRSRLLRLPGPVATHLLRMHVPAGPIGVLA